MQCRAGFEFLFFSPEFLDGVRVMELLLAELVALCPQLSDGGVSLLELESHLRAAEARGGLGAQDLKQWTHPQLNINCSNEVITPLQIGH